MGTGMNTQPDELSKRRAEKAAAKAAEEKAEQELKALQQRQKEQADAQHATNVLEVTAKLNALHAVVTLGGKTLIMTEQQSQVDPGRIERTFSNRSDIELRYMNERYGCGLNASGKPIIKTADAIWLEAEGRRQYDEVVLDPCGTPGGNDETRVYNLFRGWRVKADAAFLKPKANMKKWKKVHDHVLKVICNGHTVHARWVFAWIAERLKHPNKPGMVAIVLIGEEGAGKGVFATHIVGGLYNPQHFVPVANPEHLTGRFNNHLADALLVFADEAYFAGDPRGAGQLFTLITEDRVMLEPKFADVASLKNQRSIIMSSNHTLVVPAGPRARRFAVFEVDETHIGDHKYFKALLEELDGGGREEMVRYLLQEDFSDVNVLAAPMTDALMRQKEQGFKNPERYWFDLVRTGFVPQNGAANIEWGENDVMAPTATFVRDYLDTPYMKRAHQTDIRAAETQLGMQLAKFIPSRRKERHRSGPKNERPVCWVLPPLAKARAELDKALGAPYPWDGE
jgi:hypothetical protein